MTSSPTPEDRSAIALDLADRLFAAIAANDLDALRNDVYSSDVVVWHNNDNHEQRIDENLKVLNWLSRKVMNRRYEDLLLGDRHRLRRATRAAGHRGPRVPSGHPGVPRGDRHGRPHQPDRRVHRLGRSRRDGEAPTVARPAPAGAQYARRGVDRARRASSTTANGCRSSLVDVEIRAASGSSTTCVRMPCDAAGVVVDDPNAACCCCGGTASSPTRGAGRCRPAGSTLARHPRSARPARRWRRRAGEPVRSPIDVVPAAQRDLRRPLPPLSPPRPPISSVIRRIPTRPNASNGSRGPASSTSSGPAGSATACRSPRCSGAPRSRELVAHEGAQEVHENGVRTLRRRRRRRRRRSGTSCTVRSKKFDSSCTSCSSMKLNGFFEPNSMP